MKSCAADKFGANPSTFEPPIADLRQIGSQPPNLDRFASPSSPSLLSSCVVLQATTRVGIGEEL